MRVRKLVFSRRIKLQRAAFPLVRSFLKCDEQSVAFRRKAETMSLPGSFVLGEGEGKTILCLLAVHFVNFNIDDSGDPGNLDGICD